MQNHHSASEASSVSTDERIALDVGVVDRTYPPPPPTTPTSFDSSTDVPSAAMHMPTSSGGDLRISSPSQGMRTRKYTGSFSVPHRSTFFKTKPCRFYNATGSCIKGDRCNFIHGTGIERAILKNAGLSVQDTPSHDPDCISSSSASDFDEALHADKYQLPQKPASPVEETRKKNFFPVTWRVIGGGVMMGGQRELCRDFMTGHCPEGDDCRFAHPENYGEGSASLSDEGPSGVWSIPKLQSDHCHWLSPDASLMPSPLAPSQIQPEWQSSRARKNKRLVVVPPPRPEQAEPGYSAHRILDGNTLHNRGVSPAEDSSSGNYASSARLLVRSMSTPPTPVSRGVEVVRLFAAEMP
ncbi:hypothetical protein AcW1_007352 [Taiwanofungus camphoratus]|nr:hypothetical protein AcW2_007581 [Antrodia cinnamomea]KAI0927383.1 hypothetical protein AcV5_007936 [Antrodia cinnamomea]KAI0953027.1 hypothetical protein AcW1_007352 [Antrodia cinnamomea]